MDGISDVAIVGGGGIGSAIAYFLSLKSGGTMRISVYEKDASYARSSTTLSAGGIRQQFSTPENILMSQYGFAFLSEAHEVLAVRGEPPEMGLKEWGYLRLVTNEGRENLGRCVEIQRSMGALTEWLEPSDIAARYPWLNSDDLAAGALGHAGEGVFDPYALLQALRRKSIAQGVVYRDTEVVGLERGEGGRIEGVILADGSREGCGTLINAAGPAAASIAAMAGVSLPVLALKAHTFSFSPEAMIPGCPIVMAPFDLLFRPEGHLFITTKPTEIAMRDATGDFEVEYEQFDADIWPALAHRVPQFETLKLQRGWVGHVEYNVYDSNAIIGRHSEIPNFVFANGFSGHGIQHAPAVGRGVAELLLDGGYQTIDLTSFDYDRIRRGNRIIEIAA